MPVRTSFPLSAFSLSGPLPGLFQFFLFHRVDSFLRLGKIGGRGLDDDTVFI